MLILDELWFGQVAPAEQPCRPNSDYIPHLRRQEECEQRLKAELSEEGKQTLEAFRKAEAAIDTLGCSDSFAAGFRTGVLMMLDVFLPECGEIGSKQSHFVG